MGTISDILETIAELPTEDRQRLYESIKKLSEDESETHAFSNHAANNIDEWKSDKEDEVWK